MWRDGQGHATQSDYRHMSQSKYRSPGSCQTNYVTLWDNMHPILTFDGCKTSKEYYYVPQPIGRNVPQIVEINIKPQMPVSPVGGRNVSYGGGNVSLGLIGEAEGVIVTGTTGTTGTTTGTGTGTGPANNPASPDDGDGGSYGG